jgi:hypothetical protein
MPSPADHLWRVNNEYQKRLSQVRTYLDLLEQMLCMQPDVNERILAAVRHALEQVELMAGEHRAWRYAYYYDSPETRRVVQSAHAINRALVRFTRMRTQHERRLHDLHALLHHLQPPDPHMTRVPNGDLWLMTQYALNDLTGFDDYVRTLA